MIDVVSLGELLIDFVQCGTSEQGNLVFEANPGGAVCNVLAMLQKAGYKTAFIGKVGEDSFGKMLGGVLEEVGIATTGLVYDKEVHTTLALVHTFEDGDRDFSFYRNPGADIMLEEAEVNMDLIKECKIFHFGSLSLTDEPSKTATKAALACAMENGKMISFDPNLRPPLWKNMDDAKEAIWYGIERCDILKIADNEIQWLTGEEDYDRGIERIKERSHAKLINVTLGKEGSIAYYGDKKAFVEPFLSEKTIETTGAGDTFCACVLAYVLEHGLDSLEEDDLRKMLSTANAAASIVTTRKGAIRSMPQMEEVMALCNAREDN